MPAGVKQHTGIRQKDAAILVSEEAMMGLVERYKQDLEMAQQEEHVLAECIAELQQRLVTRQEQVRLLRELCGLDPAMLDGQLHLPSFLDAPELEASRPQPPAKTLTGVQVAYNLLLEHGPMHVKEIMRLAQEQGVALKGNKQPHIMMRDKLYGSKKFVNFGGNVWGLPGQTLEGAAAAAIEEPMPGE